MLIDKLTRSIYDMKHARNSISATFIRVGILSGIYIYRKLCNIKLFLVYETRLIRCAFFSIKHDLRLLRSIGNIFIDMKNAQEIESR